MGKARILDWELWNEAAELLPKDAVIEIAPAARVVTPKRKGSWAAPSNVVYLRRSDQWNGKHIMRTATGTAMSCRALGCHKRLPQHAVDIVCSEKHRMELREFCHTMLAILEGRMDARELPMKYRAGTMNKITKRIGRPPIHPWPPPPKEFKERLATCATEGCGRSVRINTRFGAKWDGRERVSVLPPDGKHCMICRKRWFRHAAAAARRAAKEAAA